jgi:hypothetical protein
MERAQRDVVAGARRQIVELNAALGMPVLDRPAALADGVGEAPTGLEVGLSLDALVNFAVSLMARRLPAIFRAFSKLSP